MMNTEFEFFTIEQRRIAAQSVNLASDYIDDVDWFDVLQKFIRALTENLIVIERESEYACDICHKLIEDNWNDCGDCPDAVSCFDCGKAGDVCVGCLEEFHSDEWPL